MPHRTHEYWHRVTYGDCTVGNHVYYARYLEILEGARNEFHRALGWPLTRLLDVDTALPVIECHAEYKKAARYDDHLKVSLWISRMQGVRIEYAYTLEDERQQLVLAARTLHVCVSVSARPKRPPAPLLEALQPYLAASP